MTCASANALNVSSSVEVALICVHIALTNKMAVLYSNLHQLIGPSSNTPSVLVVVLVVTWDTKERHQIVHKSLLLFYQRKKGKVSLASVDI